MMHKGDKCISVDWCQNFHLNIINYSNLQIDRLSYKIVNLNEKTNLWASNRSISLTAGVADCISFGCSVSSLKQTICQ